MTTMEMAWPAAERAALAKDNLEEAWRRKREKLCRLLRSTYCETEEAGIKSCPICGGQSSQLVQAENGLLMCQTCRQSEISSMKEAAGLLYTTYGNFKRLFCGVTFRYPDLEISGQSMHEMEQIRHGDPQASGLVQVLDDRDSWLSLRIARDIPRCFLEELYAQTFARLLEDRREIRTNPGTSRTLNWVEGTQYYLRQSGRERQAELFPKPSPKKTEAAKPESGADKEPEKEEAPVDPQE